MIRIYSKCCEEKDSDKTVLQSINQSRFSPFKRSVEIRQYFSVQAVGNLFRMRYKTGVDYSILHYKTWPGCS
jgi:hypothetical protein